jgi:outer membrane immunogenic protein
MNRSPIFAAALLSVAAFVPQARAADIAPVQINQPTTAAVDWAGLYAGLNAGYGWGRSSWSDPVFGFSSDFDTSGGLAGGQLGYSWQTGRVVFGIETDLDWAPISGSLAAVGGVCGADGGGQCETKQSWFGTTRGRIGYAFGNWLPYVTGGAAYGDIQAVQPTGTSSTTNLGWAAGAGLEYSLNRNWSAKLEYLHLDLGTASFFGAASQSPALKVPLTDDIVRAGVNYHW